MLTRELVKVSDVGEVVVVEFGTFTRSLEFVTALELAALIKREARYAKASAGDDGWRRSSVAILHDANAEKRVTGRRKALPERLKLKDIEVRAIGQIVSVRIGGTKIGLPYTQAPKIAQWIRVHGKAARNAAGEKKHWSKIVRPEVLEARR